MRVQPGSPCGLEEPFQQLWLQQYLVVRNPLDAKPGKDVFPILMEEDEGLVWGSAAEALPRAGVDVAHHQAGLLP